jgi:DNA-binding SARP family transcriptional activator
MMHLRTVLPVPIVFLRLHLLGPFTIEWTTPSLPFPVERLEGAGYARPRTIVQALLCQPDRAASRDWLMEQFWPERSVRSAEERVEDMATNVRKLLRPPECQDKLLHFAGQSHLNF